MALSNTREGHSPSWAHTLLLASRAPDSPGRHHQARRTLWRSTCLRVPGCHPSGSALTSVTSSHPDLSPDPQTPVSTCPLSVSIWTSTRCLKPNVARAELSRPMASSACPLQLMAVLSFQLSSPDILGLVLSSSKTLFPTQPESHSLTGSISKSNHLHTFVVATLVQATTLSWPLSWIMEEGS